MLGKWSLSIPQGIYVLFSDARYDVYSINPHA